MVKQMKRLKDVLPKPKQTVDVDVDDRENVEPTKADEAVSQEQTIPSGSNTAPKVMQPVSPQQVTTAMQPAMQAVLSLRIHHNRPTQTTTLIQTWT